MVVCICSRSTSALFSPLNAHFAHIGLLTQVDLWSLLGSKRLSELKWLVSGWELTTNIDFEQLGEYLGDPLVTTSIVDRLIHHSTVITINGPSWRHKESKELNRSIREKKGTDRKADGTGKKKPRK